MKKQNFLLPAAILLLAGGSFLLANARMEGMQMYEKNTQPDDYSESEDILTPALPESSTDDCPEDTAVSSQSAQDDVPAKQPEQPSAFLLPGESLNHASFSERVIYAEGFYAEPLSEDLLSYMKGKSVPVDADGMPSTPGMSLSDLRYLHIMYVNFRDESVSGELICHKSIAEDLLEIFAALYDNAYQLERVELIEAYDGDDNASMAADNTSCFNYRVVENTTSLSNHAYGAAIDINPFYNPYIAYTTGEKRITPAGAEVYEDRSGDFPHKIDTNDLCYQLFTEHGFTWGGAWNTSKDYQHFQKPLK